MVYIAAWLLFFLMLIKASGIDAPQEEVWNPYSILGLDPVCWRKQFFVSAAFLRQCQAAGSPTFLLALRAPAEPCEPL